MNPPEEKKSQYEQGYEQGYEEGRAFAYEYAKEEIRDRLSGEDPEFVDYILDW